MSTPVTDLLPRFSGLSLSGHRTTAGLSSVNTSTQSAPSTSRLHGPDENAAAGAGNRSFSASETTSESDFEIIDFIGKGSYSEVAVARHIRTGKRVALKMISRALIRMHRMQEALKAEINVHRRLRHPNIVRLLTYYTTEDHVVLVLEYCKGGTLQEKLRMSEKGTFSERRTANYVYHLAKALHYLSHEMRVVHRDLKLENVLLDGDGNVKLADFGWSRTIEEGGRATVCGTLDYLSPEMVLQKTHSNKTDVWSLGVMAAEMVTGKPPFYNESRNGTLHSIAHEAPMLPRTLSSGCQDMLLMLLRKDEAKRPTMAEILQHPWIRSFRSPATSSSASAKPPAPCSSAPSVLKPKPVNVTKADKH